MRFEFCGKADCPDWILAQLFHASKWDRRQFEAVCESVKATTLDGRVLDEDDLFHRLGLFDKSAAPARRPDRLDIDDVRACFGALSFILTSARRYRVGGRQLQIELEQLGLDSGHSTILCKQLHNEYGRSPAGEPGR